MPLPRTILAGALVLASAASTHLALERASLDEGPAVVDAMSPPASILSAKGKVHGPVDELVATADLHLDDVTLRPEAEPVRLVLRGLEVDGRPTELVWTGSSPLRLRGAVSVRAAAIEVEDGAVRVLADIGSLTVGPGPLQLDGHLVSAASKTPGLRAHAEIGTVRAVVPASGKQVPHKPSPLGGPGAARVFGAGRALVEISDHLEADLSAPLTMSGPFAVVGVPARADIDDDRARVATVTVRSGTIRLSFGRGRPPVVDASGAISSGRPPGEPAP